MIRIQSLAFGADRHQMMMQLGWFDPDMKLSRAKMTSLAMDTLKAFQTHMRLKGSTFDVEYMAKFCAGREQLGPQLCRVIIFDSAGGVGAEWNRPKTDEIQITNDGSKFDIEEFKQRIRGYTEEQLAGVMGLAAKNDHQDVVDAVAAEVDRRKV